MLLLLIFTSHPAVKRGQILSINAVTVIHKTFKDLHIGVFFFFKPDLADKCTNKICFKLKVLNSKYNERVGLETEHFVFEFHTHVISYIHSM